MTLILVDFPPAAASEPSVKSADLPRCQPGRSTPPDRPGLLMSGRAFKKLQEFIAAKQRGPAGDQKFDLSMRDRLRIECEIHGRQVPGPDHRCPFCTSPEEGEVFVRRLPIDYAAYQRDSSID